MFFVASVKGSDVSPDGDAAPYEESVLEEECYVRHRSLSLANP